MSREVMRQALEALIARAKRGDGAPDTIAALRAALAQHEQAEPVAWIHRKHYLLGHAENMPPADKALAQGWDPLYTTPPRREWRGLTDEEIDAVWRKACADETLRTTADLVRAFARAVEQALKEKNT